MTSSVEYFRLWRSLGVSAVVGAAAGAAIAASANLPVYQQGVIAGIIALAAVALLAKIYVFRPLFVVLVAATLLSLAYAGMHDLAAPTNLIALSGGGFAAGGLAAWAARPHHFGVAVVLAWAVCVVAAAPLTML